MSHFVLNGHLWRVIFVEPYSQALIDKTRQYRLGVTNPKTNTIFLAANLKGALLARVLLHELSHCVMVSYGLVDDIHGMVVPERWMEAEEWVCNFMANYATLIFNTAYDILGDNAWMAVPYELEKMIVRR